MIPVHLVEEIESSKALGRMHENSPVVIGIDFGATSSSFCFSVESCRNELHISTSAAQPHQHAKISTLLFKRSDGEGAVLWSFGDNAELEYEEMLRGAGKADQHSVITGEMYWHFKPELSNKDYECETVCVSSTTGNKHDLLELIAQVLKFLRIAALAAVEERFRNVNPSNEVQWVLIYPSYWNDFCQDYMRKAACMAGMIEEENAENLTLLSEPEAAALPVLIAGPEYGLTFEECRYLVLNCGGSATDIIMQEILSLQPITVKTVATAGQGLPGGNTVNMQFTQFLTEFLGAERYEGLARTDPLACHQLAKAFEELKQKFDGCSDPSIINMTALLLHKRELQGLVEAYNAKHPMTPILTTVSALRKGHLAMSKELMLSFFEPSLSVIVEAVRKVLQRAPACRRIVVVGGYGANKVVRDRIHSVFQGRWGMRVMLPTTELLPLGAAVVGAVLYGLHRDVIVR